MFIWKGLGFLVPVLAFVVVLITEIIAEGIAGNDNFYQENMWLPSLGLLLAGFANGLFGLKLNKKMHLINPSLKSEEPAKKTHSFFYIPVEYWGIILGVLAILWPFIGK